MTQYDDDADRLSEECEYCGKMAGQCKCDPIDPDNEETEDQP